MASKKNTAVKKIIKEVMGFVRPSEVDNSKFEAFREYLKQENPVWFKTISYSCNTVIDQYIRRYAPEWKPTKPEYRELLKALAECNSNFK